MRWGVPAMIFATSPFDLPQKEQRNPRAFIFAITGRVSKGRALLAMRDHFIY